jgi:hypothetical protein
MLTDQAEAVDAPPVPAGAYEADSLVLMSIE